jgi:hypothetical protein
MKYFEDLVQGGDWDEVEKYLSGFTKVDDNRYSMKIFFEIRKQKYLEALDKYVFFSLSLKFLDSSPFLFSFSVGDLKVESQ